MQWYNFKYLSIWDLYQKSIDNTEYTSKIISASSFKQQRHTCEYQLAVLPSEVERVLQI